MFISQLKIINYRNFQNTEIDFHEGINVIIGHNNAGKTNILRALGLIFNSTSIRKLNIDDFSKGINIEEYFSLNSETGKLNTSTPPSIKVEVFIKQSTEDFSFNESMDDTNTVYDWFIKHKAPYVAKLTYKFFLPEGEESKRYQDAVMLLISESKTTPADYWNMINRYFIHKYVYRIYGGDESHKKRADPDMLNRFDYQFLDAIRDSERHLYTGKASALKEVLTYFLDDIIRTDSSLSEEEKIKKVTLLSDTFSDSSKNLITSLLNRINTKPILEYSKDVGASIGGEPNFLGTLKEQELFSALRLIVKTITGEEIPVGNNGLGYNNLLYISVLLAQMQMSASNYRNEDEKKVFPMLLIEEPEAHLHPSMQFKLLKFLRQNFKIKKQVRQVFITSHSTHITAAVDLDEIICLNYDESNLLKVSYPGKVFDNNNAEDIKSKAYVKRFLDATKSDMLFAKRIIFVEGISEQLLMSCFAKYIGKSIEDNHVTVVSVNGRYFNHFLKLFNYQETDPFKKNALHKKVACIIDADPTRKSKINSKTTKCFPFELHIDDSKFEYEHISSVLNELDRFYTDVPNIKICSRRDGKGKTFEYDLIINNPDCDILLTDNLSKHDELKNLIKLYKDDQGIDEMLELSTTYRINHSINISNWEDEEKKKALIAARYLYSVENSQDGGKGVHALALEYNLSQNLDKGVPIMIKVPQPIGDAINFVCD